MFQSNNVLPVKIQPPLLRPLAYRVLSKKYGLNIKSDGLASLAEFIGNTFGIGWKKSSETILFLEKFAAVWRQQERGLFIDSKGTIDVIAEIKEREKITLKKVAPKPTKQLKTLDKFLYRSESKDDQEPTNIEEIDEQNSGSPILVNENGMEQIETDATEEEDGNENELDWKDYFKIINASDQQKFTYDVHKFQFVFKPSFRKANLLDHANQFQQAYKTFKLPDVNSKSSIFSTRYYMIRDRIMRNESFQNDDTFNPLSSMISMQNSLQNNTSSNLVSHMSLTLIKNLLGRDGKNFLLLGLLRKNSKGNWSLEDPSGHIEIDISQAFPTNGLYYVPGCIVLSEGIYFSATNTFHVTSMVHPPGERREVTLDAIGNIDLLGIHGASNPNYISKLDTDLKIRLHYLEKELIDHRMVVLGGDIFLDDINTISALRKLFTKLDEDPPTVIILYGSFSSVPVHASMSTKNVNYSSQYKNGFDTLATLLSQFHSITQGSTFLFIPGVNDPWSSMATLGSSGIWPQKPIPNHFINRMNRVCKHIIWGSNPTRIAYLAQEIVIMRDDLADRLKRNNVVFPTVELAKKEELAIHQEHERHQQLDDNDIPIENLTIDKSKLPARIQESRKIVKTILDQGHLSPFTSSIRPLVWDLDHTLTLYPIPSTLIICDPTAPQYDITYNGCKSINPGKFILKRRARYIEYRPSLKKATQEELYF